MEVLKTFKESQLLIPKQENSYSSPFRERAKFYDIKKLKNENVTEYYKKLLNLSINCEFDEHVDWILCDKFITGFQSGQIFDHLCNQNKDITLSDALNLALKYERDVLNSSSETSSEMISTNVFVTETLDIKPDPLEYFDVPEIQYSFTSADVVEPPYMCYICKESFKNVNKCLYHISKHSQPATYNSVNKQTKKYFCEICGKTCDRRHFYVHSIDKKFKCKFCPKSFNSSTNCRAHIQSHNPDNPHKCETCQREFKQKRHLKRHLDVHIGEKKFKCNVCSQMFRLKATLNNHMRLHETSKLNCDHCKLAFRDRNKYEDHIQKHVNVKKQCEICGKTVKYMKAHMNHHNSPRNHECPFCSKKFVRRQELVAHEKLHTGLDRFTCHICDKKFNRENSLKTHLIRHTTKNFACEICGRTFYRNDELGRHILSHSDTKNFKCDFCDTLFTCNRSKLRHLRNKHPQEKLWKCQ